MVFGVTLGLDGGVTGTGGVGEGEGVGVVEFGVCVGTGVGETGGTLGGLTGGVTGVLLGFELLLEPPMDVVPDDIGLEASPGTMLLCIFHVKFED